MVDRSPAAARQLASRARRRVRGADVHSPDRDVPASGKWSTPSSPRRTAATSTRSSRSSTRTWCSGSTQGRGPDHSGVLRGAATVARQTLAIASIAAPKHPVLVNGATGVVITLGGQPVAVMGFTVSGGKVVEIDSIVNPDRVRRLDLSVLGD